jgi:hypothetical protein
MPSSPPPLSATPFDSVSATPRTDAFVATLPPIRMNEGPLVAAQDMREQMIMWAEFARGLEVECARKVWPH